VTKQLTGFASVSIA